MKPPSLLREIADVIGNEAMLKLAAAVGGTRVYLPRRLRPGHWLVQTIGADTAQKLSAHFPRGIYFTVPISRRALIDAMDERNMSSRQIARALRITQRTVHNYRRKRRANNRKGRVSDGHRS